MLAAAQANTPSDVQLRGGRVDGDRAWVDFSGRLDGATVTGTAEMTQADGRWSLNKLSTRSGD